ncbi:ankyrin repeat domain-containing protein [Cohnella ginsengisoli]|uniref:ankyrin repeat domain-containing protein n=1 Tax=Cohnella ginsengisoli TaxID=425004 RepID=UPI003B8A74DB
MNYQSFARHPDDSNTPLHAAACADHIEVVRYLLERGADVRLKKPLRRQTLSRSKIQ